MGIPSTFSRPTRARTWGTHFTCFTRTKVQRVTVEASRNLRGHNGKVRSVCWSADDTMLVSCGMDGAAYEWSLKDFKRVGESVLKSCNYTCAGTHFTCFTSTKARVLTQGGYAVCTPDGKTTFAVGTDKKVLTLLALLAQKCKY